MFDRKRAGIVFSLLARGKHHLVPATCPAFCLAGFPLARILWDQHHLGGINLDGRAFARLLRFEDKAATFVAIDPARRARAVSMLEIDTALENVIVQFVPFLRHMRARKTESFAEADDKELVVRELRSTGRSTG